jgi:hypothetical protein
MGLLAEKEATPNGRTVVNRLTYGERAMTRPQLSQIRWIDLEEDKAARAVVFGLLAGGPEADERNGQLDIVPPWPR